MLLSLWKGYIIIRLEAYLRLKSSLSFTLYSRDCWLSSLSVTRARDGDLHSSFNFTYHSRMIKHIIILGEDCHSTFNTYYSLAVSCIYATIADWLGSYAEPFSIWHRLCKEHRSVTVSVIFMLGYWALFSENRHLVVGRKYTWICPEEVKFYSPWFFYASYCLTWKLGK